MSKIKNAFVNAQTKFMCRMAGVPTEQGDHLLEVLGTIHRSRNPDLLP